MEEWAITQQDVVGDGSSSALSTSWTLVCFLCSVRKLYTKCRKNRKRILQKNILCLVDLNNLCSASCSPSLALCFFLSPYFIASSVSLCPSWIIALLTCFVQSTQTYFLWCLPAAWLSLAHPSSAKAPVFLLTTLLNRPAGASETIRWSPAFPGISWVTWAACSPLSPYILPLPAPRWLFLPGLEGPERGQSGLVRKWEPYWGYLLFHLSPPFALESREATDV